MNLKDFKTQLRLSMNSEIMTLMKSEILASRLYDTVLASGTADTKEIENAYLLLKESRRLLDQYLEKFRESHGPQ